VKLTRRTTLAAPLSLLAGTARAEPLEHPKVVLGAGGWRVSGLKERSARELLATLILDGIIGSDTPKGPVSFRFPLDTIEVLFPSLFPET
jgi:hypothetical protein